MNEMNPSFWPLEETQQMWIEHLDATLEETTAHLTGDFAGEVAAIFPYFIASQPCRLQQSRRAAVHLLEVALINQRPRVREYK